MALRFVAVVAEVAPAAVEAVHQPAVLKMADDSVLEEEDLVGVAEEDILVQVVEFRVAALRIETA